MAASDDTKKAAEKTAARIKKKGDVDKRHASLYLDRDNYTRFMSLCKTYRLSYSEVIDMLIADLLDVADSGGE